MTEYQDAPALIAGLRRGEESARQAAAAILVEWKAGPGFSGADVKVLPAHVPFSQLFGSTRASEKAIEHLSLREKMNRVADILEDALGRKSAS